MEAKHTPGPWNWQEGTPHVTRKWDGHVAVIAIVDSDLPWHEDRNCEGREQGANARLIAAAPDLMRAAQDALSDFKFIERVDPTANFKASILLLQQAIAKATGSQQ